MCGYIQCTPLFIGIDAAYTCDYTIGTRVYQLNLAMKTGEELSRVSQYLVVAHAVLRCQSN